MLNITIEWTGVILCILGILQAVICTKVDRRTARYFVLFFSVLILFALSNILGQEINGSDTAEHILLLVSVYLDLCLPSVLAYIISKYLLSVIDPEYKLRIIRFVMTGLLAVHIISVGILQALGLFNGQDIYNLYHRSSWYPITYLTVAVTIFFGYWITDFFSKAVECA